MISDKGHAMDGRARTLLVLGLGLLAGAGCAHQAAEVSPLIPRDQMTARVEKEEDQPKRQPKASTCVALGQFNEQAAIDSPKLPLQQAELRERARRAYQQALKIDPNYLPAYQGLARVYEAAGDQPRVLETYRQALKAHPRDAGLWHEQGMYHARQQQWEPAVASLRKATELDPENRQYTNALGFSLAAQGRYNDSLVIFQKTSGPDGAHYNLARLLQDQQQTELSKQHLQAALEINPKHAGAQQLLASLEGTPAEQAVVPVEAPQP